MMNEVFRGLLEQGVVVDLDDILIYSNAPEEYEVLLCKVLQ